MGHYVKIRDDDPLEVPGAFIRVVLSYMKETAGFEKCMEPLIGNGNYEWHSSLKVLPLSELDAIGLDSFASHLERLLKNLPEIAQSWNRPEFQPVFREYANLVLKKLKAKQSHLDAGNNLPPIQPE